jgi:hypothetical protein
MISRRAERRKAADERIPSAAEFNVTGLALLIAVALFARDNSAVCGHSGQSKRRL